MGRILVTGGRSFANLSTVRWALDQFNESDVLVHGNASGADSLCRDYWSSLGRTTEAHPADWEGPCDPAFCKPGHRLTTSSGRGSYCPAAGVRRNQVMVELGAEVLIMFQGGRGTRDMAHRCEQANIPILSPGTPDEAVAAIADLIDHTRQITPSERAVVYLVDVEGALGYVEPGTEVRKLGMKDTT